jgi:hypothetical protein
MRAVFVVFLACLAFGYGHGLQVQLGLPGWPLVMASLGLALLLQLLYARLVNSVLDSIG